MTLARRNCYVLVLAFVTLVQFSVFTASEEAKPGWSIPSGVKSELINGYRTAYKDEGQGTAIVFIHGANADYRSFGPQVVALASSYRVVAPSLRHYYPEQWNGEGSDFSVEQHAADVAALIRMLNLGKVHLVGWSRGGAVAIEIAKAHPDLVRTLVMEDGVIFMPVEETPESRNAAEFRLNYNKAVQEHLQAGDPNKAAEVLVNALSGPGAWQGLPEPRRQVVLDNIYTALGDKMIRPSTTCDQLKKFDFPVLLMTAEKSPKSYAFFYGEMKKCAAFPDPIVIPGAAHNIHGGNVDAYNKALMAFFERAEAK
jgi:esterase